MERRKFLGTCVAISGTAGLVPVATWAEAAPRLYDRARLVDIRGAPLKARAVVAETNYVFHYPFVGTPCFLLNLGRPVAAYDHGGVAEQLAAVFPDGRVPVGDVEAAQVTLARWYHARPRVPDQNPFTL